MITHDTQFETLAKAPIKQTHTVVSRQEQLENFAGFVDDGIVTLRGDDLLTSVKIDSSGELLGTVARKASLNICAVPADPEYEPIEVGDVFRIRLGVNPTSNDDEPYENYNYISQGLFIVDEIKHDLDKGTTIVEMSDHMLRAGSSLYSGSTMSSLVYDDELEPVTVEVLATELANVMQVSLMNDFSNLPNADHVIIQDLYSNMSNVTLRDVAREIASATGTTARVSEGVLTFVPFTVYDETLTPTTLKTLTVGENYGPITSVILGRVPQNDNIAQINPVLLADTITNVDVINNLITVVSSGLQDGSLVQLQVDSGSAGLLPAPLESGVSYYAYTNGSSDTFALTPTYDDAIAGTNVIDLTTTGTGSFSLSNLATQEVQVNNNQILDNYRQDLLPPLYRSLLGIGWTEVKATTTGLGWFEVGDVIKFNEGSNTVQAFITEIKLTFDGGVKETLGSKIPDFQTINYQTAGGILKTLYNTEIKVDKQAQDITSVVEQQVVYENLVQSNFTELYQNIEQILLTVQRTGGGNLILNSVGFAKDRANDASDVTFDKLTEWVYNDNYDIVTNGEVASYSSSESQNAGGISGQVIEMKGLDVKISQTIDVAVGPYLSMAMRVKNGLVTGSARIAIYDDTTDLLMQDRNGNDLEIVLDTNKIYDWEEIGFVANNNEDPEQPEDPEPPIIPTPGPFIAENTRIRVEISTIDADKFMFTDLRMAYGEAPQGWVQSAAEILSTNVQFTKDGMKIFDNVHDTETQVTYNQFATRRRGGDNEILFEADDTGVTTRDLSVKGSTSYYDIDDELVIRQITIPIESGRGGIAFTKG